MQPYDFIIKELRKSHQELQVKGGEVNEPDILCGNGYGYFRSGLFVEAMITATDEM